jgi:hypothetical protein
MIVIKSLNDSNELLSHTKELLTEIHAEYAKAKTTESIVAIARPKVKSCLEHLRSVLEYIASDLAETLAVKPRRIYFPYGRNVTLYQQSLRKNLPGLDNKYEALIEGLQPHVCGDKWLIQLASASNFNKHIKLDVQERKNFDATLRIGNLVAIGCGCGVGQLIIDGVLVNPSGPLSGDSCVNEVRHLPNSVPITKEYGSVRFVLKESGVDVLDLLQRSHTNISQFVADLQKI